MIRFFSVNDPYRLLVVLVFMLGAGYAAHVNLTNITVPEFKAMIVGEMMADGKVLYADIWDSMPPLSALINRMMVGLAGREILARHLVTVFVFFLQASYFGILLNRNRAFEQISYFPSFLYGLLVFFSLDAIAFTREVWASMFLLMALDCTLREIQFRDQQISNLNVLGILVGISSLCTFSYAVFFPGILVILILTSRMDPRKILMYTAGFLFPHLLLITVYYIRGYLPDLMANFYYANFQFNTLKYFDSYGLLILSAIPISLVVLSFLRGRGNMSVTRYQSQISVVMLLWLLIGVLEIWLARLRSAQNLVVCIPPVAYYVHHYAIRIRRAWITALFPWVVVAGIFSVAYLSLQGKISGVSYEKVLLSDYEQEYSGKKLLVLSDDLSQYQAGSVAGYFSEWALASAVFREPGFYEHIVLLNRLFAEDPPQIIVDPENLMPGVFRYLPKVARQYRVEGNRYFRIHPQD